MSSFQMESFVDNYRRLPVFLKWIELLIAIVTIGILQDVGDYPGSTVYRTTTIYTAICSYLIILPVLLIGYNMSNEVQKLLVSSITRDLMISVWGINRKVFILVIIASILWLTAGALMFDKYMVLPKYASPAALICSGILTLLNGCLFIADAVATYREE
ncbi:hypothetical protein J437_LFUL011777 [Ladona fulva]|uniref:Uncharacterized protein n=1 Tax=Ladona fulva TaxID=123851 RepID=A0A8K0KBD8_LADFU|nr:hypothetical protein J437_LFUL011777 [Ladona fulva]